MKEAAKFKRGNIILISLTHHLHDIYSSFLAPLRPLLIEKFELTYSLSALWDIIIRIPWFLNPLFGIIAEKTAARYIVIFTPAVTAIAMSLLGVAPTFAAISILLFVAGISSGMFHVPTPVMVQQLSGKFVGKGMSYYMFVVETCFSVESVANLASLCRNPGAALLQLVLVTRQNESSVKG